MDIIRVVSAVPAAGIESPAGVDGPMAGGNLEYDAVMISMLGLTADAVIFQTSPDTFYFGPCLSSKSE